MSQGKLTDKQREILNYIKESVRTRGFPPAVREICDAVGLSSTSSVHSQLSSLEKKGYIKRDPTKPRAIEILDESFSFNIARREMTSIPIVGQVAAGVPILAEQNIENYFPLPTDLLPGKMGASDAFILKVKGESMVNVGIMDGDLVFVRAANTAKNGDIVVALIEDSATVKTFYKENGKIRLQPENDTMDPIIVNDCRILGTVFGVFRLWR